jgi:Na+/proline symporter
MFSVYAGSSLIGSPSKMVDLLTEVGEIFPCANSYNGSYLTFSQPGQLMSTWSQSIGGFAIVFGDPSYGQKALAASPKAAMGGYIIGGMAWFVIPWTLGTSAGLASLALMNNPASFTYPNPIPVQDIDKGLPVIYGMGALLGKSGAAAGLVMLFMSVTSATSAELVGFSSIFTYDIYRGYINPRASGKNLVNVAHIVVILFGLAMGGLAVMFNYIGLTVGFILDSVGIFLSPAVGPLCCAIYWPRMNKLGMILAAPLGTISAVAVWFGTVYHYTGVINVNTLVDGKAPLIANFLAFGSPFLYLYLLSFIKPTKFDMTFFHTAFVAGDDADVRERAAMTVEEGSKQAIELKKASRLATYLSIGYILVFYFLIPMPMYGTNYIYSKGFFTAWIVILFVWLILAAVFITIYPIYESWSELKRLYVRIKTNNLSKQPVVLEGQEEHSDSSSMMIESKENKGDTLVSGHQV